MNNFQKLADGINVLPLAHQVHMHGHLFSDLSETCKDPEHPGYSHREASSIMVRYPRIPEDVLTNPESLRRAQDDLFARAHPGWHLFSHLRPLLYGLMQMVGGVHIGGIGIVKLKPGAQIYPHYDTGLMTDFYQRYHIVLAGPHDCWFVCGEDADEERVEQLTGEVWWFDSHKRHSVTNQSKHDRISVSIDISSL